MYGVFHLPSGADERQSPSIVTGFCVLPGKPQRRSDRAQTDILYIICVKKQQLSSFKAAIKQLAILTLTIIPTAGQRCR